jgi:hypothetical protein
VSYLAVAALLIFLVWLAGSAVVWGTQDSAIFRCNGVPFGSDQGPAGELKALGAKALSARRDGWDLRFWKLDLERPRGLIVVFHGNDEGAAERVQFAREFKALGFSTALVEYPGYAQGGGSTSEWPVLRSSLAAFDELKAAAGDLPVLVAGESLGTGVATFVAARRSLPGLILSTPYTSMAAVAKHRYPWVPIYTLIRHPIDARAWARAVRCPVLILHGDNDATVPLRLGAAQAPNFRALWRFVTVQGAGHSNVRDVQGGLFWKSIAEFVGSLGL